MSDTISLRNKLVCDYPHANIDSWYGPYNTLEEAKTAIPYGSSITNRRAIGITVGIYEKNENGNIIGIKEYWWKTGITDDDLVEKKCSGGWKIKGLFVEGNKYNANDVVKVQDVGVFVALIDGVSSTPVEGSNEWFMLSQYTRPITPITISFVTNGGSSVTSINTFAGLKLNSIPSTVRLGYTFNGWYEKENYEGNPIDTNTIFNTDTILYAKWTPITYSIVFNNNGGIGTMNKMTCTYGQRYNLLSNTFSREKYKFIGWATSQRGNVVYTNEANISNLATTNGATVTLYAVWESTTKMYYKQFSYTEKSNVLTLEPQPSNNIDDYSNTIEGLIDLSNYPSLANTIVIVFYPTDKTCKFAYTGVSGTEYDVVNYWDEAKNVISNKENIVSIANELNYNIYLIQFGSNYTNPRIIIE